jgi:LAO/AO transport system kinase
MWAKTIDELQQKNFRTIARCISGIENNAPGHDDLLQNLPSKNIPVIGITGPPGAGKSTLVNGLIREATGRGETIAVLCIDPASPFHRGALLGDRIRMSHWYNHPDVYIRSLSARGSLGGLHPRIFEISDLLKIAGFDQVIIETVGIGQSEVEIAGIADVTVVVLVPESGDEIQAMKAGLMEIADIFVVNKCDHPEAKKFLKNLRDNLHSDPSGRSGQTPVLEMIATRSEGIDSLSAAIQDLLAHPSPLRRTNLLTEKAYRLILEKRMSGIDKKGLFEEISRHADSPGFNIYRFVERLDK